jgi:hypothetical protein
MSTLGACRNEDEAGAQALWDEIHAADYTSWPHPPGYTELAPSSSHGNQMEMFINDVVSAVFAAGQPLDVWPDGSMIVKNGYDGDGALTLVAVMEKRGAEWYWAEYEEDGEVIFSGTPRLCIKCHDAGSDYVRAFQLPK